MQSPPPASGPAFDEISLRAGLPSPVIPWNEVPDTARGSHVTVAVPRWLYHLARVVTPRRSVLITTACFTGTAAILWASALRAGNDFWPWLLAAVVSAVEVAIVWRMAARVTRGG